MQELLHTGEFFVFVANLIEPFLIKNQPDKLMVPFMYCDIKNINCNTLEIIVKPEVLVKVKKPHKLKDIDLSNMNNLTNPGEMSISKKLKQKGAVDSTGIRVFKKIAQKVLAAMAEKLLQRTSLASFLLQSAEIFDRHNLLQMSKEKTTDLFKSLLTKITQLNSLLSNRCDQALAEFKYCFHVEVEGIKLTSFVFSQKEHRLAWNYKYKELSYLVRIILTLSHGQAAAERGFNHNNYVLQPNMTPNAITSKRLIKGHMLAYGLEPHTIELTKPING